MAFQIIDTNTTGAGIQVNLGTVDSVFVAAGVTLGSTNSFAIRGTGNGHLANIQGTVISGQNTIYLGDSDTNSGQHLSIGDQGYVGGLNPGTYAVLVGGYNSLIENDGTIWAAAAAILIAGSSAGTQSKIVNRGLIEAGAFGAITRHDPSTEKLIVENSGTIRAPDYAYRGFGTGATTILNSGSIFGDINFNVGGDVYDGTAGRIQGAVDGGGGADILFGGAFSESLGGGAGSDTVSGRGGDDFLGGGDGADIVRGGAGSDEINGGAGADQMFGDAGNDFYGVDNASDIVNESGGNGTDLVQSAITFSLSNTARAIGAIENLTLIGNAAANGTGNTLNNVLTGNGLVNVLNGMVGNDTLNGGGGNDTLVGAAGNDVLIGGLGRDTMTGGAGNDIFRFSATTHSVVGPNADRITDFDDFGNDRIDISALFGPAMTYRHNAAFTAAGQVRINDIAGADLLVEVNTGGTLAADFAIWLAATTLASMTAGDFIL